MLYTYGVKLGLQSILDGSLSREHVKKLVVPVNYWRTLEFRLVLEALGAGPSDRILDIGSPKLLSLYLSDVVGAEVFATDIHDYFVKPYRQYGRLKGVAGTRFHALPADGCALPFRDGSFNKIYSISVLEHIPGRGDSACAAEIGRALCRGGTCAITVPFAPDGAVEYRASTKFYWAGRNREEPGRTEAFYQRRYREQELYERIIRPSGLEVEKVSFMGERFMSWTRRELSDFLPALAGPLHPMLSRVFHVPPRSSWREVQKPLGALVVLKRR
jgi:ubiquinone/menaquinone biosynthesis C-methylase UbiE